MDKNKKMFFSLIFHFKDLLRPLMICHSVIVNITFWIKLGDTNEVLTFL